MSDAFLSLGGKVVEAYLLLQRNGQVVCSARYDNGSQSRIRFISQEQADEWIAQEKPQVVNWALPYAIHRPRR